MQRINELLRDEIAELLRREVKDEVLSTSLISITEVDTAPDLRNAKVYFSVYGSDEEIQAAQQHLTRAAAFLRRNLMDRLDLRYTPRLEFLFDPSLATGDRIMRLMRQIEHERDGETSAHEAELPASARESGDRAS
jgi:ribosome-binding factor A